jgi:hypothetical protein
MAAPICLGILFSIVALNMGIYSPVSAHSGRTDAYGGHNCYVGSCAGTYHYHNGGYSNSSPSYICKISSTDPNASLLDTIGRTFYSHSEAEKYWNDTTRDFTKQMYNLYLNRNPSEAEYRAVIKRAPYNYCRGDKKPISNLSNELMATMEYKDIVKKETELLIARQQKMNIETKDASSKYIEYVTNTAVTLFVIVVVGGAVWYSIRRY